jgi:dTMP kinase
MTRSLPGALVVIEGIDGSGKSSVARRLASRWRRKGHRVVLTREPVDRRLGKAAVELAPTDPWGAATLFSLDRLLARPAIARALRTGAIVLQDRSYFSTIAYQGERLSPQLRDRLHRLQTRIAIRPDRVLWLDVPPDLALARVRQRGGPRDALERRSFLRGVRRGYARLARDPRWRRVDARGTVSAVVDRAEELLDPWLKRRRSSRPPRR